MTTNSKNIHLKILYIFFLILSLNIFFFSTDDSNAKAFDIDNIDISKPFEINFNKNEVIDEGFKKSFFELISLIVNSEDIKKVNEIKLNEIKSMIESFTIKEEKFINQIYYVKLGVSFNKKKIFNYLDKKNIFPSIPLKKKFFFIPILINESEGDLLIFNNNKVFDNWNNDLKSHHLIEYILPTEDLEDLNFIKNKFDNIEQYNFKEITNKYNLKNSIIALIFRNEKEVRVLSRITNKEKTILKNQSFSSLNLNRDDNIDYLINDLKSVYEDYWKSLNQINTSIKLNLSVKVENDDNKISSFEKTLRKTELVYNYYISKFDKEFTYYKIIFNGTPDIFLENMNEANYNFNISNKIWTLK